MELYKIEWKRSAVKELKKLSKENINRILETVEALSSSPFPNQTKKLVGSDNSFRIRVGDYRIIYTVLSKILTIEIIRVGHRRDIYKR